MKAETRKRCLDILILFALAVALYYFVDLFFFLLFPIGLGLVFSQVIRKSFARLRPLTKGVKRILIILVLLIFFALISLCGVLLVDRILRVFSYISEYLTEHFTEISQTIQNGIRSAEDFFSEMFRRDLKNSVSENLPQVLRQLLQEILAHIPSWMGKLASSIPSFILSLFIFLLCTYYFSCDWERFSRFFKGKLPEERQEKLLRFKNRFFRALGQWTRAYFLLFLLTFAQLFLGLSLLRLEGAAEKAFLIAFVDLLPILGCGTVMIPWSLSAFLTGKNALGIGLLILYLVIFSVRQIAEPKIVGTSIGLHPVLSLILVLTGLKFFGFFGMIFLPLLGTCLWQETT